MRVACAHAGLPAPVPQYVVVEDGDFLGEVDPAWPEARLVVEYEGLHHVHELQIRRDDRRYERLVAAGWRVIRLSAADLRDMEAVVRRIAEALGETARVGWAGPSVPAGTDRSGSGGRTRRRAPGRVAWRPPFVRPGRWWDRVT